MAKVIEQKERRDIKALRTSSNVIDLRPGQYFCETDTEYEIWSASGSHKPRKIKRISKHRVVLVWTFGNQPAM